MTKKLNIYPQFLQILWQAKKTQSRFLVYRSFLPLGPNTPKTSFDLATPLMFLRTCFCFKLMFKFRKTISFESISSIFHWRVKNKRENKIRWSLFVFLVFFWKRIWNIFFLLFPCSVFFSFYFSVFLKQ